MRIIECNMNNLGLDSDAYAHYLRMGSADYNRLMALNTFVKQVKRLGLWDKLTGLGVAASTVADSLFNLKNASYDCTYSASPSIISDYLQVGGGTDGFAWDTDPDNLIAYDSGTSGIYLRNSVNIANDSSEELLANYHLSATPKTHGIRKINVSNDIVSDWFDGVTSTFTSEEFFNGILSLSGILNGDKVDIKTRINGTEYTKSKSTGSVATSIFGTKMGIVGRWDEVLDQINLIPDWNVQLYGWWTASYLTAAEEISLTEAIDDYHAIAKGTY